MPRMTLCNHMNNCADCTIMKDSLKEELREELAPSIKKEAKKEMMLELLPLFTCLLDRKGDEDFQKIVGKLKQEYCTVPETWEDDSNGDISSEKVIKDLQSVRNDVQKLHANAAEVPVIKQQLRELCYSEKEEIDVLQCDLEVAPAELKGNFLKERIERLEESEEELKKENQEIRKENEEMHLQIDG